MEMRLQAGVAGRDVGRGSTGRVHGPACRLQRAVGRVDWASGMGMQAGGCIGQGAAGMAPSAEVCRQQAGSRCLQARGCGHGAGRSRQDAWGCRQARQGSVSLVLQSECRGFCCWDAGRGF